MRATRVIPSIEQLRQGRTAQGLEQTFGREAVVDALQAEAAALRELLRETATGEAPVATAAEAVAWIESRAATRLDDRLRSRLRPVINATGVIVHTNLGRAPLAAAALDRVRAVAGGYAALELDLASGTRGRRDVHADALLQHLTGAEAALVVNNNAAAALLVLTTLAQGREVIVSRGELVEIGGGFRVPDVLRQSGAVLREVGTTNRTRAADYAAAIGDRTAALLRVHPSNFTMSGFTERPALSELAAIAARHGLPLIEDLGSGWLEGRGVPPLDEPTVQASIRAGADLVTFSGDKLLGGPQAGIIVGRARYVDVLRRHPLMRALRVDKLTYAALEATLSIHARGAAAEAIPVVRMIAQPVAAIDTRARALVASARAAGLGAAVVEGVSAIGGGAAPGVRLATRLVALDLDDETADGLLGRLRALDPPVIARIEADRVVLDLRTVSPEDDAVLEAQLRALKGG